MNEKIIQIIPADQWFARYRDKKEQFFAKLSCWAVVEDDNGDRRLVGMDGDGDSFPEPADMSQNFVGYHWHGKIPELKSPKEVAA